MTTENKILDEAIRLRRKRLAMKTGYTITALIVGLLGFIGIWHYCGWEASLAIILLLWGSNLANTAKEL